MNITTPCISVPREGECPAIAENVVGTCVEECKYDVECPEEQKCCSNGCGHVCMDFGKIPACSLPHSCNPVKKQTKYIIDGLVQDCSICSMLVMEILQSCTKHWIYVIVVIQFHDMHMLHF